MLNRRILRIKAFKTLYSYSVYKESHSLVDCLSDLEQSCESTRDLYLFMLAIISPLTKEARNRIEAGRTKFNPTYEDLNPNEKFANNRLAVIFDNDPDFQKLLKKKGLSWDNYDIFIKKVYDSLKTREYFNEYLQSDSDSLQDDCKLFIKIFENEFDDNLDIEPILEEKSLFWLDDLAYSLTYCCKTMEDMAKGHSWSLPPLYLSEMTVNQISRNSDSIFVRKILQTAYANYDKYLERITSNVQDWDKDRLFITDICLIILCLAEVESFPDVDIKIPINEYVEISKFYSSPKSKAFVNGILHKLLIENNNK